MAYSKQTWGSNELITAEKLNHIEDGIPTKTSQLTNDSGFLTSHQSLAGKKNTQSAVSSPSASGTAVAFIDSISQDAQGVITPTKKTVATATTSADGLMSADDKTKLNGIASGAQVNSITGVKGDTESSYRTGNINLTPANIGAVKKAGDAMTGMLTVQSTAITLMDTTKGNLTVSMHIGANGPLGLYSNGYYDGSNFVSDGKWLIYRDANGITRLGNAVQIINGGTGATSPEDARTNLGIHSVMLTKDFSSGICNCTFGEFGINARPNTIILTPCSLNNCLLSYNWDASTSNIVIMCINSDGTTYTGRLRFCAICVP